MYLNYENYYKALTGKYPFTQALSHPLSLYALIHYIIKQKIIKENGLVPFTFKYSYDTNKDTKILL